jgi:hypothetical protein
MAPDTADGRRLGAYLLKPAACDLFADRVCQNG